MFDNEKNIVNLYKWESPTLGITSPDEATRNAWLWHYGAFCRYNGVWFPCKFVYQTTIGEPAQIQPVILATAGQNQAALNLAIYPAMAYAAECEVIYSVFPSGLSIRDYVGKASDRMDICDRVLYTAIDRSINTFLIQAPPRLVERIKAIFSKSAKDRGTDVMVVPGDMGQEIKSIVTQSTANILSDIWDSKDWSRQEIFMRLGIPYNPASGKRERLLTNEIAAENIATNSYRELLTARLKRQAAAFGEGVKHIAEMDENAGAALEGANP